MKTIFTLLTSLFLSAAVFAADAKPKSSLTIQSIDNADVRVIIDGRRFEPNDNHLRIDGLGTGSHSVKIYQQKNTGVFSIFGNRYQVVFNSFITIKPRTNVMISIDRFGRTIVSDVRTNGRNGRGNNGRDWDNDRDFDFDHGGGYGDYDSHNAYESAMSDREFSRVLESIQKEWLETNKLKSATQIVTANRMTSAQVKEMMWLFSFENNKLELAKRAYNNTVDKRNYSVTVNGAFSFNSSKEELARYIRNFR